MMKHTRVSRILPILAIVSYGAFMYRCDGFTMPQTNSRVTTTTRSPSGTNGFSNTLTPYLLPHDNARMSLSAMNHNNNKEDSTVDDDSSSSMKKKNPSTPVLVSFLQNIEQLKPASLMVGWILALTLVLSSPSPALAAMSGGRMGGSFSSPSTSRSAPSYSRGYSSGGYYSSRPSSVTTIVPYSYSRPMIVSPFGFPGYGYGSPGIITYSRGPSFFDLLFFGGLLFAVSSFFSSATAASSGSGLFWEEGTTTSSSSVVSALGKGTSVIKLSVAMDVTNRDDPNSILSVLERLSETSKTDSRVGVQNLSSTVALELLRRRSSIVSATSKYQHFPTRTQAQRQFNTESIQERGKFQNELISKFGGVTYNENPRRAPSEEGGRATMAVITMVLAIDGDSTKIPKIRSITDVENALQKIASDTKVDDCLQSLEILWTPEDRKETLTLREVIADYPELNSV